MTELIGIQLRVLRDHRAGFDSRVALPRRANHRNAGLRDRCEACEVGADAGLSHFNFKEMPTFP